MILKKLVAVGGIGGAALVFLAVGAIFISAVNAVQRNDIRRVERLSPSSATLLADTSEGTEVLVVGAVASDDAPFTGPYVAYVQEERERRNDNFIWLERESSKPPFAMGVNGGKVRIQNDNYGHRHWNIEMVAADQRTIYLAAGDEIFVVGTLVERSDTPQVHADFVALGTTKDFLAGSRQSAGMLGVVGWIMLGLGSVTLVIALAFAFYYKPDA